LEIARQLGLHGCNVVIMGRRVAPLEAAVKMLTDEKVASASISGDVRKYEDCKQAVALCVSQFGGLNILVNSHAGNFLSPAEDLSPNGFKTVIDIDALGVFHTCHASFSELRKSGNGLIINISAVLHYGATWYQVHASAAKAAIDSMTRSLGMEWGEYGIRVCGIAPGPIADTPGSSKLGAAFAGSQKPSGAGPEKKAGIQDYLAGIPLRRFGTKLEMGLICVFLATDAAGYITGETIVADGGSWLGKSRPAPRETIRAFAARAEKTSRETGLAPGAAKASASKPLKSRL